MGNSITCKSRLKLQHSVYPVKIPNSQRDNSQLTLIRQIYVPVAPGPSGSFYPFLKFQISPGSGILNPKDGSVYLGSLNHGQLHGQGTKTFRNGDVLQGNWRYNHQSGYAVFRYANKSVYKGEMLEEKRNGKGTMTYSDGASYTGEWILDKKHGRGVYHFKFSREICESNQLRDSLPLYFIGFWRDGKRDGKGMMGYWSGREEIQIWRSGDLVKREPVYREHSANREQEIEILIEEEPEFDLKD